jgi:hypothetical protein
LGNKFSRVFWRSVGIGDLCGVIFGEVQKLVFSHSNTGDPCRSVWWDFKEENLGVQASNTKDLKDFTKVEPSK